MQLDFVLWMECTIYILGEWPQNVQTVDRIRYTE
jgi:hypothetical protein